MLHNSFNLTEVRSILVTRLIFVLNHIHGQYTRASLPPDSDNKLDIFDPGYTARIWPYIFCGLLDAIWQSISPRCYGPLYLPKTDYGSEPPVLLKTWAMRATEYTATGSVYAVFPWSTALFNVFSHFILDYHAHCNYSLPQKTPYSLTLRFFVSR